MQIDIKQIIEKFRKSSLSSKNEEDVRIATNIFIDGATNFYGLSKKTSSEVSSIQGGRADSIYSDIIFEFKKPKKFATQKGIDEALHGRDDSDRGLFNYIVNFSLEELGKGNNEHFENILLSKIGVGFDGKCFVFSRFKKSSHDLNLFIAKKTKKFPAEISKSRNLSFEVEVVKDFDLGIKKLLLFFRSTKRKRLSAENLLNSFSSTSKISKESILYLYDLLNDNIEKNSRIKTLFEIKEQRQISKT